MGIKVLDKNTIYITERELEVIKGVAKGLPNKEIGVNLGISTRTVQAHLTTIANKLKREHKVQNRTQIVMVLVKEGILNLSDVLGGAK